MSIKTERISDALIEEISYIVNNKVKNDNIKFVSEALLCQKSLYVLYCL